MQTAEAACQVAQEALLPGAVLGWQAWAAHMGGWVSCCVTAGVAQWLVWMGALGMTNAQITERRSCSHHNTACGFLYSIDEWDTKRLPQSIMETVQSWGNTFFFLFKELNKLDRPWVGINKHVTVWLGREENLCFLFNVTPDPFWLSYSGITFTSMGCQMSLSFNMLHNSHITSIFQGCNWW